MSAGDGACPHPVTNEQMPVPLVVAISAAATMAMWGVAIVVMLLTSGNVEIRGQIGDSFGSINSLFSALAFSAIVVTVYVQSRELQNQLEQVRRSTKAQQEMADAMSAQIGAAKHDIQIQMLLARSQMLVARAELEKTGKGISVAETRLKHELDEMLERLHGLEK